MALSQCTALMGDVPPPAGKVRPGGPPGRKKRLQGATKADTSGETLPHTHCCSTATHVHTASFYTDTLPYYRVRF